MSSYGGRRRSYGSKAAVTSAEIVLPRKSKCAACRVSLAIGDTVLRLRLKKQYQVPCTGCGHKPGKLKFFHLACAPDDINKAMGHDPVAHAAAESTGGACAPPPKPKTVATLELEALVAFEACVRARATQVGITAQIAKEFATYERIKARVLRPGTPAEGEVSTSLALQRIVKMVFAK